MTLERLWAAWRAEYVASVDSGDPAAECLFCALPSQPPDEALLVAVDERAYVALNLFPYTSGHLMVAPRAHESDLERLADDDAVALLRLTQRAVAALKTAYTPDGVNVGMNLGRAAGAGIPGHLHVHVLPRWNGDTNFMTSVAELRVLPESLPASLARLRAAWPGSAS